MGVMKFIQPLAAAALAATLSFAAFAAADAPNTKFDPKRDAAKDVAAAVVVAKKENKRVMVDVGGEWCSWCHILDNFVDSNEDVKSLVASNYVWVKVNYSPDNKNEKFLSKFPKIKGYPHLLVLDANGKLVQSQNTSELEAAKTYDKEKMIAFLQKYAPARR